MFQLKIDKLVSDNMLLITIEQLNELAKKIDEENISHINNSKYEKCHHRYEILIN